MSAAVASGSRLALEHARLYRRLGFNPLPSREDEKRPLVRFAHLWEELAPDQWFTDQGWFDTSNLQVMVGRAWRLCVIDLDGHAAIEQWPNLRPTKFDALPRTWESTSGGGGRHVWFSLPYSSCRDPLPRRVLWQGEGKHSAIEFLCDRSLVVAPPSIHPRTGRQYRFRAGHSPRELPRPAYLPRWVLDLPAVNPPQVEAPSTLDRPKPVPKAVDRPMPDGVRRDDVLAAIHDKAAVAKGWGLRIASDRDTPSGWVPCHDFNREDANPSASFHPATGMFWRPGMVKPMSLFDLGSEMGHYADWLACCTDLATTHHVRSHHASDQR